MLALSLPSSLVADQRSPTMAQAPPVRQTAEPPRVWQPLAMPGSGPIGAIAVAPGWPADGTLVVGRGTTSGSPTMPSDPPTLYRSTDRGATWQELPKPPFVVPNFYSTELRHFAFAATRSGKILYVLPSVRDEGTRTLYRSLDDGRSWETASNAPTHAVRFSPTFQSDGVIAGIADGVPRLSTDRGQNWRELALPDVQQAHDIQFSPMFAQDRTLFVAATGADPRDPEGHAGVLTSHDSGETWVQTSVGLEVDAIPYQYVERLAVSPSYTRDRTLFAYSSAPRPPRSCLMQGPDVGRAGYVFRSADAGGSWEPISDLGEACHFRVDMVLSPSYFEDHVFMMSVARSGSSPASSGCIVSRSDDGGDTWNGGIATHSYGYCNPVRIFGDDLGWEAIVSIGSQGTSWRTSTDKGRTWHGFLAPDFQISAYPRLLSIVPSPRFGEDRTYFYGDSKDLRTYGRFRLPDGSFGCPLSPVQGFARVWTMIPELPADLDCPLEAERPVRLRVARQQSGSMGYWPDVDDLTIWFRLHQDGRWTRIGKSNWMPESDETVVDGAIQRFTNGWMLWVPQPDGSAVIFALGRDAWTEHPDAPAAR
jgi:hypothetical protein